MPAPTPPRPHDVQLLRLSLMLLGLYTATAALADRNVTVVAWVDEAYTARKSAHNPPLTETYVFMQGRRFASATRDNSLERQGFLDIAKSLAVELARDNYKPARDVESADLLLLVHWGTTRPRVSLDSLRGTVTLSIPRDEPHAPGEVFENHPDGDPANEFFVDDTEKYRAFAFEQAERVADSLKHDLSVASNAALLGYTTQLRRLSRMAFMSTTERTMRHDLETERYFIIVKAFDLKTPPEPGTRAKPVWTLHLNMRSPGQNFRTALANMSRVAVEFAGRSTTEMTTVDPRERTGRVELGPLKVIGYVE
jgi:hypothetical protein